MLLLVLVRVRRADEITNGITIRIHDIADHLVEIVDALAGDTDSRSIPTGRNQQLEAASVISHPPDRATRVREAHNEPGVVDASRSRVGADDLRPGKEGQQLIRALDDRL